MPDTCLQGSDLPAHILWKPSQRTEILVRFSDGLELRSVYNAAPTALDRSDPQVLVVKEVEVGGYLGLVFRPKPLVGPKGRAHVEFLVRDVDSGAVFNKKKTVDIFRPLLRTLHVPEEITVKYDAELRVYSISDKLKLANVGDGTAILAAELVSNEEFIRSIPSGTDQFIKRFSADLGERFSEIKREWPKHARALDEFLELFSLPLTLDSKSKRRIQTVFRTMNRICRRDERFELEFASSIAVSYIRNIQLITEMQSFMDYLDSIGEGRVVLLNSIEVFKARGRGGRLPLKLQMTDLASNDYEPLVFDLMITCDSDLEIPIHLLFDWKQPKEGKTSGRGSRRSVGIEGTENR